MRQCLCHTVRGERRVVGHSWADFTADPLALTEVATARPEALKIMETIDFDG